MRYVHVKEMFTMIARARFIDTRNSSMIPAVLPPMEPASTDFTPGKSDTTDDAMGKQRHPKLGVIFV